MNPEAFWWSVVDVCKHIYFKHGHGIAIPSDPDPDPLRVFDEVDVAHNPFRFTVYIMWLRQQPGAFDWFCCLLAQHEELVRDTMKKLNSYL